MPLSALSAALVRTAPAAPRLRAGGVSAAQFHDAKLKHPPEQPPQTNPPDELPQILLPGGPQTYRSIFLTPRVDLRGRESRNDIVALSAGPVMGRVDVSTECTDSAHTHTHTTHAARTRNSQRANSQLTTTNLQFTTRNLQFTTDKHATHDGQTCNST